MAFMMRFTVYIIEHFCVLSIQSPKYKKQKILVVANG